MDAGKATVADQLRQLKRAESRQQELKELYQGQFKQREQLLKDELAYSLQESQKQFFAEVQLLNAKESQLLQKLQKQEEAHASLQEQLLEAESQLRQLQLFRKKAE